MKKLNKRGFTLIELLAVLVILVVIMAIAIPSITSSIERSKNNFFSEILLHKYLLLDCNRNYNGKVIQS